MAKKLYKVEILQYQSVIVEAENEDDAKLVAMDTPDREREWESEEINNAYRCDENGEMIEDESD